MSAVETWVNDKLHDILGLSDKYIAQYLIGLAQKSPSADEYVEKLRETGTVEIDQSMVTFSKELWNKVYIKVWVHFSKEIQVFTDVFMLNLGIFFMYKYKLFKNAVSLGPVPDP